MSEQKSLTAKNAASKRIGPLLTRLHEAYPDAECALHHKNAFELLVATILSAQCTDERVNKVTPALFARFPTPEAMASADIAELEDLVRSTGFFRNKAKNIQGAAQRIVEVYNGEVPTVMEDLLTLPGVARKTANVVRGVCFELADGVVVDTHVKRLAQRLGLTKATTPEKIEPDLMKLVPRTEWINISHLLIFHGRQVCDARKPRCAICTLADLCPSAQV
jgi:endonuclease-3